MVWFLPLMLLIFMGLPVAFSLGVLGFLGLVTNISWNAACSQFTTILFGATNSYPLSCIPMFILMGELCFLAGITDDIFKAATVWFGRLRGGLAIATCFACAAFGACSGSTIASASIFTKMTFPKMVESGYDKRLASGVIASAGALACMIPPSILMVIYGIIASQPINKLLIAGFVPGIMTAIIYAVGIYGLVRVAPRFAPQVSEHRVTFYEKLQATKGILGLGALFLLVMGGLFVGLFTSTGAGAIGAVGALVILISKKRFNWKDFKNAVRTSGVLSCSLLFIIAFGNLFSFVISTSGELEILTNYLIDLKLNPTVMIIYLFIFYFILGCMIDPTSMLIITLPPVMPIAEAYGFDPVWFGIIVVTMLEVGVMTPPVGMNVYTVKAVAGDILSISECFSGTGYFVFLILISLAITIAFPEFILFVPNQMNF